MPNKKESAADVTFEAALARLEEIVRALEGGNAPLDSSLAMFEEGVSLVKQCNNKLDRAEQRIKILVSDGEGGFKEEDFVKNGKDEKDGKNEKDGNDDK